MLFARAVFPSSLDFIIIIIYRVIFTHVNLPFKWCSSFFSSSCHRQIVCWCCRVLCLMSILYIFIRFCSSSFLFFSFSFDWREYSLTHSEKIRKTTQFPLIRTIFRLRFALNVTPTNYFIFDAAILGIFHMVPKPTLEALKLNSFFCQIASIRFNFSIWFSAQNEKIKPVIQNDNLHGAIWIHGNGMKKRKKNPSMNINNIVYWRIWNIFFWSCIFHQHCLSSFILLAATFDVSSQVIIPLSV